ncbi:hypothetical protein AMTR_s00002p00234630 [Amborella trichopoda]|uniref:Uncharacterized protein n=1 Tax=Amborella trichopoda TaxID=13333 RepID=W1P0Z3_AMBTC|nr:hypothetical protein AMTR_s00002p00234630 [Amborella trichopoda]
MLASLGDSSSELSFKVGRELVKGLEEKQRGKARKQFLVVGEEEERETRRLGILRVPHEITTEVSMWQLV